MPSTVTGNRLVLIFVVAALLGFALAFTAITILGRRQWLSLKVAESLVARLSGSALLALIAVGCLSGVVNVLVFPLTGQFDPGVDPARVQAARLQAELGILVAIGLTIAAVVRVESAHRRSAGSEPRPDAEDWEVDEPETVRRPG
ncbi:MAG TPA: hypothetical protein VET65_09645 [Candidatus Limnocylindrales bacterium]|nr:hypothetical protein [Candidatus Limnocylindrales bacterium]